MLTKILPAEHVFELHIIKDFFYWIYSEGFGTCQALKNIFDSPGAVNIADAMMKRLAYFDGVSGPLNELFVLEDNLNFLKGAVCYSIPFSLITP